MANALTVAAAKFVRDLLTYNEQLIRIGREDFTREQMETAYIVVDDVGPATRISSGEEYDGTAESMELSVVWRGALTLDFFGDGAYARAATFVAKMRSQAALDLRRSLAFNIYEAGTITDVKALVGQQYGERVQIACTAELTTAANIDTLRIDTAQIEIRNEQGVQYVG